MLSRSKGSNTRLSVSAPMINAFCAMPDLKNASACITAISHPGQPNNKSKPMQLGVFDHQPVFYPASEWPAHGIGLNTITGYIPEIMRHDDQVQRFPIDLTIDDSQIAGNGSQVGRCEIRRCISPLFNPGDLLKFIDEEFFLPLMSSRSSV